MDSAKLETLGLPAPLFATHQITRFPNPRKKYLTLSAVKISDLTFQRQAPCLTWQPNAGWRNFTLSAIKLQSCLADD